MTTIIKAKKKVMYTFQGELYYCNHDDINELITYRSLLHPKDGFTLSGIKLINDFGNGTISLVGDLINCEFHDGFTIKTFLYKDGKALRCLNYTIDCIGKPSKIEANFKRIKGGYVIYGSILTEGTSGSEGFILHVYNRESFVKKVNHLAHYK